MFILLANYFWLKFILYPTFSTLIQLFDCCSHFNCSVSFNSECYRNIVSFCSFLLNFLLPCFDNFTRILLKLVRFSLMKILKMLRLKNRFKVDSFLFCFVRIWWFFFSFFQWNTFDWPKIRRRNFLWEDSLRCRQSGGLSRRTSTTSRRGGGVSSFLADSPQLSPGECTRPPCGLLERVRKNYSTKQ